MLKNEAVRSTLFFLAIMFIWLFVAGWVLPKFGIRT